MLIDDCLPGQAELALLHHDSTVIDAIVQHLASRNEKARQAAIFAISRISSFQVARRSLFDGGS